MEGEKRVQAVRRAAANALQAQKELSGAWGNFRDGDFEGLSSAHDVQLLRDLILHRIYPVNAFAALVRVDPDAAIEVFFSRYVGRGVDPDNKFGGYAFELGTMLSDLVEARGASALRGVLRHPHFNAALLSDPRVLESIAGALSIEVSEAAEWAESAGG